MTSFNFNLTRVCVCLLHSNASTVIHSGQFTDGETNWRLQRQCGKNLRHFSINQRDRDQREAYKLWLARLSDPTNARTQASVARSLRVSVSLRACRAAGNLEANVGGGSER